MLRYYNGSGIQYTVDEPPLEPPGLRREKDLEEKDTDALRREFIKDNPAALIDYLEGYDETLIEDFIRCNLVDYYRWLAYQ